MRLPLLALALLALALPAAAQQTPPPRPVLPIPNAAQLAWQREEMRMFVHFSPNTYTNREWGTGEEDPAVFAPTDVDAEQWAQVARRTGFGTVILTAKHHDGFCLWPSRYTRHSVAASPWQGGRGDVVRALAEATRRAGVRMGLYLSPWDRHEPSYGDENAYNSYYMGQLTELLTEYGPLAEVWFDGAKGEDAKDMAYDFPAFWALVRQHQPGAVLFSDAGPDVRWIGNERGHAGETNWSMLDRAKVRIGGAGQEPYLNGGDPAGPDWVPGECDVSIRKGWFWHPEEQPRPLDELLDIYYKSVGRNCLLLLNVPPNREGRFDAADVARLDELHAALGRIFGRDLAAGARATASNTRGRDAAYAPALVLDGNPGTYWATDDSSGTAWLELALPAPATFDVVRLQEPVALGQRVAAYRVEVQEGGAWRVLARGTTIGHKKLDRVPRTTAQRVRVVIEQARAHPLLAEVGLHLDGRAAGAAGGASGR